MKKHAHPVPAPLAPRPCGHGHDEHMHVKNQPCLFLDCNCTGYLPSTPDGGPCANADRYAPTIPTKKKARA